MLTEDLTPLLPSHSWVFSPRLCVLNHLTAVLTFSSTSFSSPAHLQFPMFMYLTFANESLAECRTCEDRKCSDESLGFG